MRDQVARVQETFGTVQTLQYETCTKQVLRAAIGAQKRAYRDRLSPKNSLLNSVKKHYLHKKVYKVSVIGALSCHMRIL